MAIPHIKVDDVTPRKSYTVGGTPTSSFTFDFSYFTDADLKVYVGGVLKTLTTHYTVTGASGFSKGFPGGTVTLATPVTSTTVAIVRDVVIERSVDFSPSGPLVTSALNTQIDKLIAIDQQLSQRIDRSIVLPDGDPDFELVLPAAADRANKALTFDAIGAPYVQRIMAGEFVPDAANVAYDPGGGAGLTTVQNALRVGGSGATGAVNAALFGVTGDGSDQTEALQAAVDSLPSKGGRVLVSGDIEIASLDLKGRSLITFEGLGGWGAGADQQTTISFSGSSGERVIDARDTIGIAFNNLKLSATNSGFSGYLVDFGKEDAFSQTMRLRDCVVLYNGTGAGLNLFGAVTGNFDGVLFGGSGTAVALQQEALPNDLLFCNVHSFTSCNFTPSGSAVPVLGSGEQIKFKSCNVQASTSDGKGRFWNTSIIVPFNSCGMRDCALYDVTAPGEVWANFYAGTGLALIGNRIGGVDPEVGSNYGFGLGGFLSGVRGFVVLGNNADYVTSLLLFDGTALAGTYATAGLVGGNSVRGSTSQLYGNLAVAGEIANLPNHIAQTAQGTHFFIHGLPTDPGPLSTGDFYNDSGTVKVAP